MSKLTNTNYQEPCEEMNDETAKGTNEGNYQKIVEDPREQTDELSTIVPTLGKPLTPNNSPKPVIPPPTQTSLRRAK